MAGQIAEVTVPAKQNRPSMEPMQYAPLGLRGFAVMSWIQATIRWWNSQRPAVEQRALESHSSVGQAFRLQRIWLGPPIVAALIWTLPLWGGGVLWGLGLRLGRYHR